MPSSSDSESTLNAAARKAQRDSHGNTISKDEAKYRQQQENELHHFLRVQENFYEKLKKDPSCWKKETLDKTRDFFWYVLEHQDDFPLDSQLTVETLIPCSNQNYDESQMKNLLSEGFVQSITDKSWSYDEGDDEPVVQILYMDEGKFQSFSSGYDNVKIVCLTVIDRNGHRLLARVAAHLTDTAVHLKPGHVLRLKLFNDMLMKPFPKSPPTAVIVIVQMDVIGSGLFIVDESDTSTPFLDEMPTEPMEVHADKSPSFDSEEFEPPPVPECPCTYDDRLCSQHRLNFRRCVCEKIPVLDQDLESIKSSCPFATGDSANDLLNREKRNMLYWWYATNVFLICGKNYRKPLPDCLVYAIRCAYPNPKGEKYVGFHGSGDKRRRKK